MLSEPNEFASYVGQPHEDVVAQLKKLHPTFVIHALELGSLITMDIRGDRIRVWYASETGLVTSCVRR